MVSAPDEDCLFVDSVVDDRRRVAVVAFRWGLVISEFPPRQLARLPLEGGQVGFPGMHRGDDDVLLRQDRRRPQIPVELEFSEPLLEIGFPEELAGFQIESRKRSALEVGKDEPSIGCGGGICTGTIPVLASRLRSDRRSPEVLAGEVEAEHRIVLTNGRRKDDLFTPDDRR